MIAWTRRSELELDPALNRYLGAGTEVTMIRRRFKQTQSLEERLAEEPSACRGRLNCSRPRRHTTIGYLSPVEFERKVGLA